jgi:hypothetical protein
VLRLASLAALALLAGATAFVLVDRSHLASEINQRRELHAACAARYPSGSAAEKGVCGWAELQAIRTGELLGLPFFALAGALMLILLYKCRTSSGGDPAVKMGEASADDAML